MQLCLKETWKDLQAKNQRERARKAYLAIAKQRRVKLRTMRKAIGMQLRFISSDLRIINELTQTSDGLSRLLRPLYKELLVIGELYRQQQEMYDKQTHSVPERIVR